MAEKPQTEDARPTSITRIVGDALDLDPAEWPDYLDRTCGDDAALRAEAEDLLALNEARRDTDFLEVPAVGPRLSADEPPPDPELIGPYRILKKLGEGGMGTVYLAEQDEPVHRRVALKVIRILHQPRLRRRFAAECQALARLSHSRIAAMYEVGITQDAALLPWVAMEWVDGLPITEHCDRHRLGIRQRLRIFLGVCAAIQHAHEKSLLHCDLKPSNVLVTVEDGEHVAKVIDFGIARALDTPLVEGGEGTRELVLGSPPYISPEAMTAGGRHRLDTRTDVYSLGLVLHELLVGALPFDIEDGSWIELLRELERDEIRIPSRRLGGLAAEQAAAIADARAATPKGLRRAVHGDLDAIVAKAIDRDPARRYGSPAELADDLERHLGLRPIRARPATSGYLAARFVRRHLGAVAATLLLVFALAGGLVARTIEAERTRRALAESEQVRDFMVKLFEGADPERALGEALTVRELLDQGAERLRVELADQPEARARFLQTIGSIYTKLGDLEAASSIIDEALQIRRTIHPPGHPEIVESLSEAGVILRRQGRLEEAESVLREVLAARMADPEVDPELLARAHSNLGNLLWSEERFNEAEEQHRIAYRIRDDNAARLDTSEARSDLAISATNLGAMLMNRDQFREARPYALRAVELFRQENHALLGAALNNLGLVERHLETWKQAEALFREAIKVQESVVGPAHVRPLRGRRNLVDELVDSHRWSEAIAEGELAVHYAEGMNNPINLANVLRTLGNAQRRAGMPEKAIETHRRSLEALAASYGPEHTVVIHCRTALAAAKAAAGRLDEGIAELRAIAELQSRTLADDHPTRLRTDRELARALEIAGRPEEAEVLRRRVLSAVLARMPENSDLVGYAHFHLGRVLGLLGRDTEAVDELSRALDIVRASFGDIRGDVGNIAHELATVEERIGNLERARQLYALAVRARAGGFPPDDPDIAASREALERISRPTGPS